MFAKLYEPEPGQQILVKLDQDNGGPEVRVYCEPEGLGVCSVALKWSDDENGWEQSEKCFHEFTEEQAVHMARQIRDAGRECVED